MTAREGVCITLCCLLLYPLSLLALSGPRFFDRPFWADEVLSWLLASDPSYSHSMAALAGGVDTNAPLLHWIYRLGGNIFGHTPLAYRLLSTLAMSLGLLGVYATLRRHAGRWESAGGAFALLALPVVLAHTTEARFYGFFLAAATWCAYLVDSRTDRPRAWNAAGVGIASFFLCSVHYFGVLALGCLLLFAMLRTLPRGLFRVLDTLWPAAVGPATTLCLLPLLRTQREALAGAGGTWVPDQFLQNLITTLSVLLPTGPALVLGLLMLLALLALRGSVPRRLRVPPTSLLGLLFLPLVLIAFDRLIQPVLVPRYLLPAMVAVPVLVSACLGVVSLRGRLACLAALAILFIGHALHLRTKLAHPDPRTGMGILAQVPADDLPVVADWRGHLLPIWADRPSQRNQIVFLDDPRIAHPDLDQSIPFEREMVRIMNRFYGFPRTIGVPELAALERFRFVTEFPESAPERLGPVKVLERSPLSLVVERPAKTAGAR